MAMLKARPADTGLPLPRRLWAIASISSGSVLYTLDGGIPGVALPVISEQLGIPSSSAVLLVSVYNLVLAMTLLPLAAIGERLGHRRVFVAGLASYLVAASGSRAISRWQARRRAAMLSSVFDPLPPASFSAGSSERW